MSADPRIDYSSNSVAGSKTRYLDVAPTVANALELTGQTSHEFNLPNSVYSLGASKLAFTISQAATGVGTTSTVIRDDGWSMIESIELRDSSGTPLVNVRNVDVLVKTTLPMCLPATELETRIAGVKGDTVANCKYGGGYALGFPELTSLYTFLPDGAGSAPTALTAGTRDPVQRYLISGANAAMSVAYELSLSDLFTTPLGVDRNLFWNQAMSVVVTFKPTNQFTFTAVTATLAAPAVSTVVAVMGSLRLSLAQEADEMMAAGIKSRVVSGAGISLTVPITKVVKRSNAAGTENSHDFKINRADGAKLRCLFVGQFPVANTGADILNNTNRNGAESTNILSSYDGKQVQPKALTYGGAFPTAYAWNRELLKGSSIKSIHSWENEGATYVDDYGVGKLTNLYMDPTTSRGAPYMSEVSVNVRVTTPAGKTPSVYFIVCGEEKLQIKQSVISLGPNPSQNSNPLLQ